MQTLIDEFLLAGRADGWSQSTVRQYRRHLEWFRDWLAEKDSESLDGISRSLLRQWAADMRDRWAPATCAAAIKAIRSWLAYCDAEGHGGGNLVSALKVPRIPKRVQRTISPEEVRAMLEACDRPARSGLSEDQAEAARLRNGALVAILFDSLIRAGELVALDLADLDLPNRRICVLGKGGGQAWVRFSEDTAGRLRSWIRVRSDVAQEREPALFVAITGNRPGRRLTTSGLRIIVRRLGERAGIDGVSPHAFRRGGAVAALENGAPSRLVQLHGRWARLDLLELYTRSMQANAIMDRYSPMIGLRNGARAIN